MAVHDPASPSQTGPRPWDLLPDTARAACRAVGLGGGVAVATVGGLVGLAATEHWWAFAGGTVVSVVAGAGWTALKALSLLNDLEDRRVRRMRAQRDAAVERRFVVLAERRAAVDTAAALTAVARCRRERPTPAQLAPGPAPAALDTPRPALASPVALSPVPGGVIDYEVETLVPSGAEVGWVYRDGAGTVVVVVGGRRGRHLARLEDLSLVSSSDLVPPLSVVGGVAVDVLPITVDPSSDTRFQNTAQIAEGTHG